MTAGELIVELGFKSDNVKLKDFIHSLGELNLSSIAAALGVGGLFNVMQKVMTSSIETAKGISHFGHETGISTDKMQKFVKFAEQMGVSSSDAESSLRGLQQKIFDVQMGKDQGRGFLLTNISPYQDTLDVVQQLYDRFNDKEFMNQFGLSIGKGGQSMKELQADFKRMIASDFNLTTSMLNLFDVNRDVWDSMDKIGVLSAGQIKDLMELNKQWVMIKQNVTLAADNLSTYFAPKLGQVNEALGDFSEFMFDLGSDKSGKIFEFGLAIIGFLNPASRLVTVLAEIALHIKDIQEAAMGTFMFSKDHPWMDKILSAIPAYSGMKAMGAGVTAQKINHFHLHTGSAEAQQVGRQMEDFYRRKMLEQDSQGGGGGF